MQDIVQVGEKWSSTDMTKFKVVDVVTDKNNTWVHYIRLKDNTMYSCLIDSFKHRFSKIVNES